MVRQSSLNSMQTLDNQIHCGIPSRALQLSMPTNQWIFQAIQMLQGLPSALIQLKAHPV